MNWPILSVVTFLPLVGALFIVAASFIIWWLWRRATREPTKA